MDRRSDYAALLDDQARIDRDERAEAMALLRAGQTVRVWRAGRIMVLSGARDVDLVWPPTRGRKAGPGGVAYDA